VISESIFIQPGQPMTLFPVIVASLLPSFIGAFIFFLIDKFTRNGYKVFSLISIILLVLSFANPFMVISGVTIPYAVVLNVMHVVVAGSLLYFLKRTNK
jgi:hypothetical protein